MNKIKSLVVVTTITIILLLVITEQASAINQDLFCNGPCIDTVKCEQLCKPQGYSTWLCQSFGTKKFCCCVPTKKQIFEETVQLNYILK
ncbi:defensin-like protein 75 [Arabidopsis lyrata subsp. lyrata]|uniref:defensin-like protein 75 n=1 Tax=Arabidopsis lyrata subsp. lyrata TaxID=81972 RepID=UPI000A29E57A|nr:defensin-like protein 75 [Arabidopsis lyrata subsp. lyrata]|eukprot:XP_020874176.1 defensin-like protein 75 [Arabidopsis lyrata subsp. lyrata]